MRALSGALIAVFVVIGAVACSSSEEQLQTPERSVTATPTSQPGLQSTPQPKGFDDLMLEIEREVPGFAGMSVAGNTLQVRSTTRNIDMNALKTAIVSRFPDLAGFGIEIVDVTFDFGQLSQWYQPVQDALYSVPELNPHMVSTDVDEIQNCIVIGVDTEDAKKAAERVIGTLGLPDGAVKVIVTDRAVLT